MYYVFIFDSILVLTICLILFFIPGTERLHFLIASLLLVVPTIILIVMCVILFIDKIKEFISYLKMVKKIGLKETKEFYKNQEKEAAEFIESFFTKKDSLNDK